MEPTQNMRTAVGLLTIPLSGKARPPIWLAMGHEFLSAAALALLLYAAFTVGLPPLAKTALALSLFAAAGGAVMNLNYHWSASAAQVPGHRARGNRR